MNGEKIDDIFIVYPLNIRSKGKVNDENNHLRISQGEQPEKRDEREEPSRYGFPASSHTGLQQSP